MSSEEERDQLRRYTRDQVKSLLLKSKLGRCIDFNNLEECWPWTGGKNKGGYGITSWRGKAGKLVHRVVFIYFHDWEPPVVMHLCNNRGCVNPWHLAGSDWSENNKLAYAHGGRIRKWLTTPPSE